MRLQIVEKAKLPGKLKKGWRLASRPMDGGKMFHEMIDMLRKKNVQTGGLAGESSITCQGIINVMEENFESLSHVFMIDENESDVVNELKSMFPEMDIDLIQDMLDTNKQNVDKTIDQLLQVTPTSKFVGELPPFPTQISQTQEPMEGPGKKRPACPECPVCYD